jgi:hypothetical protein
LSPSQGAETPNISPLSPQETCIRETQGQVIANRGTEREKIGSNAYTNRVAARILFSSGTITIAVKPRSTTVSNIGTAWEHCSSNNTWMYNRDRPRSSAIFKIVPVRTRADSLQTQKEKGIKQTNKVAMAHTSRIFEKL